jgi:beta-lactamase superfamily II metal-dependent hydrolase
MTVDQNRSDVVETFSAMRMNLLLTGDVDASKGEMSKRKQLTLSSIPSLPHFVPTAVWTMENAAASETG